MSIKKHFNTFNVFVKHKSVSALVHMTKGKATKGLVDKESWKFYIQGSPEKTIEKGEGLFFLGCPVDQQGGRGGY